MKHIIALTLSIFIIYLMVYTYNVGGAYHGGDAVVVIEDFSKDKTKNSALKENDNIKSKLKNLQNKAVNVAKFKVSKLYIQRCSSCHGIDGGGIIGPNLFSKNKETMYKKLQGYKAGTIKNEIMQQIVENLSEKQIKELSDEIGNFSNLSKKDL